MKGLLIAFVVVTLPVAAAEMPKHAVDMTTVLVDADKRPVPDITQKEPVPPGQIDPDPACRQCPPLTVGRMIARVLYATDPKDDAQKKWADYMLAERIKDDRAAVLSAKEVARIENKLGPIVSGILISQIFPLIDPNAKPPEIEP